MSVTGLTASGFASANLHSIHASLSGTGDIAGGYFYDTYTIQSTTLPPGSPVHVVISYEISGQLTGSGDMVYYVYTGVPGQTGLDQAAQGIVGNGTLDTGMQALDFDKSVGDSIVVEIDLSCYRVGGTCDVEDPLTVTSTTPGVTITSAAEQASGISSTTSSTSSTSSTTLTSSTVTTTGTLVHSVPEFGSFAGVAAIVAVGLIVIVLSRMASAGKKEHLPA